MFSKTLRLAIVCAFAAFPSVLEAQAGNALRWKFTVGEQYNVEMGQLMTMDMSLQGQQMTTKNDATTFMTWKVLDVDADGNATIESVITRMTMNMEGPMGKFIIDTDDEEEPAGLAAQVAGTIKPMIGVSMTQKMSPTGKVTNVTIPEEALAGIKKSPMGQMAMSADQLKEMVKNMSPVFPEGPLKVGQSWSQASENKTPVGTMQVANKYTYQGTADVAGKTLHQIGIESNMDFPEEPNAMGVSIQVGDQDTNGVLYFDSDVGRMIKSKINQKMSMKVNAQGSEMDQQIEQVVTVRFGE